MHSGVGVGIRLVVVRRIQVDMWVTHSSHDLVEMGRWCLTRVDKSAQRYQ